MPLRPPTSHPLDCTPERSAVLLLGVREGEQEGVQEPSKNSQTFSFRISGQELARRCGRGGPGRPGAARTATAGAPGAPGAPGPALSATCLLWEARGRRGGGGQALGALGADPREPGPGSR